MELFDNPRKGNHSEISFDIKTLMRWLIGKFLSVINIKPFVMYGQESTVNSCSFVICTPLWYFKSCLFAVKVCDQHLSPFMLLMSTLIQSRIDTFLTLSYIKPNNQTTLGPTIKGFSSSLKVKHNHVKHFAWINVGKWVEFPKPSIGVLW